MSTKEIPFWPRVEVWRASNGWIVQPAIGFDRQRAMAADSEVYVFRDWPECSDFLLSVTEPRRADNGDGNHG
jgi:hypothetical protein